MTYKKNLFITFEGPEGSGKTTQSKKICDYFKIKGIPYVYTREPGGTIISEKIRNILLSVEHSTMSSYTELLLYIAGRYQNVTEIIRPALESGKFVLCDRFMDASVAYQGYGRNIDIDMINTLNKLAIQNIEPDITFFIDIDVETGLKRAVNVNSADRIEKETLEFHKSVREGYIKLSEDYPDRILRINGLQDKDDIFKIILNKINELTDI